MLDRFGMDRFIPVAGVRTVEGYVDEGNRLWPPGYGLPDYDAMRNQPAPRPWWKASFALGFLAPYMASNTNRRTMRGLPVDDDGNTFPGGSPSARDGIMDPDIFAEPWNDMDETPGFPLRTTAREWWKTPVNLAFTAPFSFRPNRNVLEYEEFNSLAFRETLPYAIYKGIETSPTISPTIDFREHVGADTGYRDDEATLNTPSENFRLSVVKFFDKGFRRGA